MAMKTQYSVCVSAYKTEFWTVIHAASLYHAKTMATEWASMIAHEATITLLDLKTMTPLATKTATATWQSA